MERSDTIYSDPDEVFVLAYVWRKGNASGGRREVLLRKGHVEARLAELVRSGEIDDTDRVQVMRLASAEWVTEEIAWPVPLRIGSTE